MSQEKIKKQGVSCNFIGLEIGAVSTKWVERDMNGKTDAKVMRHEGSPTKKIKQIIDALPKDLDTQIVVTGQASRTLFDLPYRAETECLEKAMKFYDLKPDILLSLGGETFSVYTMKNGLIHNIIATSKCAAGTGEFIVQQFSRMNLSLEEGIEQSMTGKRVPLATRCSVHCKSDATHKLNKGECAPGDIAKSLIYDLAEKIYKMIDQAQWPKDLVVLSGGVTLNKPFVDNLQEILGADSKVMVLSESPYLEAFGASLFALELSETIKIPPRNKWLRAEKSTFETLRPLTDKAALLDYRVKTDEEKLNIVDGASYILGIDAGSTTTKGVLLNTSDKTVGASSYLRTHGNPISATKNVIADLIKQVGEKDIKIIQTGVTGSGREMDSVYLDNCLSFNEILAHARATTEEVPDVDTVFEIGGQDSKFVSFLEGIPVDYAMNEGCSAGTGSFLEESASIDMGIPMREISGIAEKSEKPLAFGERCAAFINTDLRSAKQLGASQEDVTAGLVYSIADNYISRIVGSRYIGENLLFQGGVALNKSVALAMVARTGRKVVVPPHPELMGCVGTCLMAMDLLESGDIEEKIYKLSDLVKGDMETKGTFRCKSCENTCEVQMISIRGKNILLEAFVPNLNFSGIQVKKKYRKDKIWWQSEIK